MIKNRKPAPGAKKKTAKPTITADRRFEILAEQIRQLHEIIDEDRAAIRRALPHVMWDK